MTDDMVNFAATTIETAPSPATSGTDFYLTSGPPSPTAPYDLTVWPSGNPTYDTAEIIRITAQAGNHVTACSRHQYGTSPIAISAGYQCEQGVTANLLSQLGGGGLPAWFQSGSGDPINTNPTVPNTVGGLYFDTSGTTGLWTATASTSTDWAPLGIGSPGGLSFSSTGAGTFSAGITAVGAGSEVALISGSGLGAVAINDTYIVLATNGAGLSVFVSNATPNGNVTAFEVGDVCYEPTTPAIWQATAADNSHWIQTGGILPTSAAGLVTGSLWNNSGVVNVA